MKHSRNGILKQIDRGGTKLKCNFMSSSGKGIATSSLRKDLGPMTLTIRSGVELELGLKANTRPIDRFQSRGRQLCKLLGIKESFNRWKEFDYYRIFFVHKHGRRDVMWKRSIQRHNDRLLRVPRSVLFFPIQSVECFWLRPQVPKAINLTHA